MAGGVCASANCSIASMVKVASQVFFTGSVLLLFEFYPPFHARVSGLHKSGRSANARVYVSRRFTGTSRGADAGCLYDLNTQHDPRRGSSLAWRTGGDDNGLLGAL